jgi:hypothetical protein
VSDEKLIRCACGKLYRIYSYYVGDQNPRHLLTNEECDKILIEHISGGKTLGDHPWSLIRAAYARGLSDQRKRMLTLIDAATGPDGGFTVWTVSPKKLIESIESQEPGK